MAARNITVSLRNCASRLQYFKPCHVDDLADMLVRSKRAGVVSMIITGGSLRESELALKLAKEHSMYWRSYPFSRGIR